MKTFQRVYAEQLYTRTRRHFRVLLAEEVDGGTDGVSGDDVEGDDLDLGVSERHPGLHLAWRSVAVSV